MFWHHRVAVSIMMILLIIIICLVQRWHTRMAGERAWQHSLDAWVESGHEIDPDRLLHQNCRRDLSMQDDWDTLVRSQPEVDTIGHFEYDHMWEHWLSFGAPAPAKFNSGLRTLTLAAAVYEKFYDQAGWACHLPALWSRRQQQTGHAASWMTMDWDRASVGYNQHLAHVEEMMNLLEAQAVFDEDPMPHLLRMDGIWRRFVPALIHMDVDNAMNFRRRRDQAWVLAIRRGRVSWESARPWLEEKFDVTELAADACRGRVALNLRREQRMTNAQGDEYIAWLRYMSPFDNLYRHSETHMLTHLFANAHTDQIHAAHDFALVARHMHACLAFWHHPTLPGGLKDPDDDGIYMRLHVTTALTQVEHCPIGYDMFWLKEAEASARAHRLLGEVWLQWHHGLGWPTTIEELPAQYVNPHPGDPRYVKLQIELPQSGGMVIDMSPNRWGNPLTLISCPVWQFDEPRPRKARYVLP